MKKVRPKLKISMEVQMVAKKLELSQSQVATWFKDLPILFQDIMEGMSKIMVMIKWVTIRNSNTMDI